MFKCQIYLDVLQLQVLRHLESLTHSEDVPYYIFRRVAKWPKLGYYLMNENIALSNMLQDTIYFKRMFLFIYVYRNMSCQYLVSLINVGTDTVLKHVFNQQGVWLITYLSRGDNMDSVNEVLLYTMKLIIYYTCREKRKTNLEHIFTVDKTKSRMSGLQVVQCLDTHTECYDTDKPHSV